MHDNIAGIDQHPVARFFAFHRKGGCAILFQCIGHVIGKRRYMARCAAAGHNHEVSKAALIFQVQGNNFFTFIIVNNLRQALREAFGGRELGGFLG